MCIFPCRAVACFGDLFKYSPPTCFRELESFWQKIALIIHPSNSTESFCRKRINVVNFFPMKLWCVSNVKWQLRQGKDKLNIFSVSRRASLQVHILDFVSNWEYFLSLFNIFLKSTLKDVFEITFEGLHSRFICSISSPPSQTKNISFLSSTLFWN